MSAARAGMVLGRMHEGTALNPSFARVSASDRVRAVTHRSVLPPHPERAKRCPGRGADHRGRMMTRSDALCHGDYSPKNILTHAEGFTLVDYETATSAIRRWTSASFLAISCSRTAAEQRQSASAFSP